MVELFCTFAVAEVRAADRAVRALACQDLALHLLREFERPYPSLRRFVRPARAAEFSARARLPVETLEFTDAVVSEYSNEANHPTLDPPSPQP